MYSVCVFWPPTGRVFPTIGVSTRRAGLPPKPLPQGLLIPTLGTVPRLLYMYRNFRPPKRQRRGTMASFQDLGKLCSSSRLCLFPLARLAREAWRDGIKAITMGLRRWPHDGARGAMRLESLNALRKDYWWIQARIRSFLVRTG